MVMGVLHEVPREVDNMNRRELITRLLTIPILAKLVPTEVLTAAAEVPTIPQVIPEWTPILETDNVIHLWNGPYNYNIVAKVDDLIHIEVYDPVTRQVVERIYDQDKMSAFLDQSMREDWEGK
jgi:hypothetical protein